MADHNHFDVGIFGTGLAHSILAAALAPHLKVIHFDTHDYYGEDDGNLQLPLPQDFTLSSVVFFMLNPE